MIKTKINIFGRIRSGRKSWSRSWSGDRSITCSYTTGLYFKKSYSNTFLGRI